MHRGEVRWIFEADIVSFFDSLDRTELKKMLAVRVADGSLLRRIGKCLHVGVLDGEALLEPELGTTQGAVLSPLLGNVSLHYVLDRWFETEVQPRLRGKATLIRYCDDFLIGFEREDDARRVLAVLEKRLGRFGLASTRTRRGSCPLGVRRRGNNVGQVRPPSTFWASRAIGRGPGRVDGGCTARQGGRASDGPSRPSTTGVVAIGTNRSRRSTPRSVNACEATATTSASAAIFVVCCGSSKPRSGPGTNGCAVAASARA